MSLAHFSSKVDAETITVESVVQATDLLGPKPRGFWISDENGDPGWSGWCESEQWGLGEHIYHVELSPAAHLLWLTSVSEIRAFNAEFRVGADYSWDVDWPRVARTWQGIFITPYQWELRLSSEVRWYYTWDCASGCVWDASAIAAVTRVPALDNVPA
jgi:hypothetical protein